jgi:hypothetical protein
MEFSDNDSLERDSKVIIFSEKKGNSHKSVYFYLEDICGDGIISFNIDYEINNVNGTFENGNGFVDLDNVLKAYKFKDYNELKSYLVGKFESDTNAFYSIIADMKSKGITLNVDESKGVEGSNGFSMWGGF